MDRLNQYDHIGPKDSYYNILPFFQLFDNSHHVYIHIYKIHQTAQQWSR